MTRITRIKFVNNDLVIYLHIYDTNNKKFYISDLDDIFIQCINDIILLNFLQYITTMNMYFNCKERFFQFAELKDFNIFLKDNIRKIIKISFDDEIFFISFSLYPQKETFYIPDF